MIIDARFTDLLSWINTVSPLTRFTLDQLKHNDYSHIKLLYAGHIEPKIVPLLDFFIHKGMDLHITPCVPQIKDLESFSYLEKQGAKIYGIEAQSWDDLAHQWARALMAAPSRIFDIGGGVIKMAVAKKIPISVASEATSTGINNIKGLELPFPVFDWNDIPLKRVLHNRYEVGPDIWFAFRKATGLNISRLQVGVIGFGDVGHGIAAVARGLGAHVSITESASIRQLKAASEGYKVVELKPLLASSDIIVAATGQKNTITVEHLNSAKDGLIILNAGHDSRDINLKGIKEQRPRLPDVDEFTIKGKKVYLLSQGRLLNLAVGGGSSINTFDIISALMALTVDYIAGDRANYSPGLHLLPEDVIVPLQKKASSRIIDNYTCPLATPNISNP